MKTASRGQFIAAALKRTNKHCHLNRSNVGNSRAINKFKKHAVKEISPLRCQQDLSLKILSVKQSQNMFL